MAFGHDEQRLVLRIASFLAGVFVLEKSLGINLIGDILTHQLVGPISLGLAVGVLTIKYIYDNWAHHKWG